jgi:predicted phosphodiesterase
VRNPGQNTLFGEMDMKKHYLLIVFFISVFTFSVFGGKTESASADANFYFVQITDTHLGLKENNERTRRIIKKINALPFKVAFVVHTGDIVDNSVQEANTVDAAKELFSRLNAPVYFISGNHDIFYESQKTDYEKKFGALNYIMECHNVVFIFIYTNTIKHDPDALGKDFFKWFENTLKKNKKKPVIIFEHIPPGPDFYDNRFQPSWWPVEAEKKWVALINSYEVKAVITGHFHRDELHWLGNVPLYICSPVSGREGRQATFRVYQYKNGKLSYFTQYIDNN